MEKSSWPAGLDEMIKPLWREPHANRQIELAVFIDDKVNMDGRDGGRDSKGDSKWDLDGTKRRSDRGAGCLSADGRGVCSRYSISTTSHHVTPHQIMSHHTM